EFDVLGKRVFGPNFSANAARAAVAVQQREMAIQARLFEEPVEPRPETPAGREYQTVRTAEERARLIATLLEKPSVCMDIVPSTTNFRDALPLGIAFSVATHSATYAAFPAESAEALAVLEEFRPFFENDSIEKVGHDLKPQASLLRWHGT